MEGRYFKNRKREIEVSIRGVVQIKVKPGLLRCNALTRNDD